MTRVRAFLSTLFAAALCVACERPARTAAPYAGASALQAIPLGAPPGEPLDAAGGAAASVRNPFEGNAGAVAKGKALFGAMNCVYCHASGGAGLMGPPLNTRGWRYGGTPAQIYNSIHDGRPQGMPAWGQRLPPEDIWRIVAYIESLGGAEPPATAAMPTLAAPGPSATGPQVADQSSTDAAEAARKAANAEPTP